MACVACAAALVALPAAPASAAPPSVWRPPGVVRPSGSPRFGRGRGSAAPVEPCCGAAGAAVLVLGGAVESFWLLLVGAVLLGATTATNLQSRYAAADLAARAAAILASKQLADTPTANAVKMVARAKALAQLRQLGGLSASSSSLPRSSCPVRARSMGST